MQYAKHITENKIRSNTNPNKSGDDLRCSGRVKQILRSGMVYKILFHAGWLVVFQQNWWVALWFKIPLENGGSLNSGKYYAFHRQPMLYSERCCKSSLAYKEHEECTSFTWVVQIYYWLVKSVLTIWYPVTYYFFSFIQKGRYCMIANETTFHQKSLLVGLLCSILTHAYFFNCFVTCFVFFNIIELSSFITIGFWMLF